MLETDLTLGTTVWIDHTDKGDIAYKVKIIHYRDPRHPETCRVCSKGNLRMMGTLIQYGLLDDKIYTVMYCDTCHSATVFVTYVTSNYWRQYESEQDNARQNR